jgi:hypothetical protein
MTDSAQILPGTLDLLLLKALTTAARGSIAGGHERSQE